MAQLLFPKEKVILLNHLAMKRTQDNKQSLQSVSRSEHSKSGQANQNKKLQLIKEISVVPKNIILLTSHAN